MDQNLIMDNGIVNLRDDKQLYFNRNIGLLPITNIKKEPDQDFDMNDPRENCIGLDSTDVNVDEPVDLKKDARVGSTARSMNNERESTYGNYAALFVETLINDEQSKRVIKTHNVSKKRKVIGGSTEDDDHAKEPNTSKENNQDTTDAVTVEPDDTGNDSDSETGYVKTRKWGLRKCKTSTVKESIKIANPTKKPGDPKFRKDSKSTKDASDTEKRTSPRVKKLVVKKPSAEDTEKEARLNPNVKDENGQQIFECRFCKKTYDSLKSYKAHSYDHKGKHICNVCQTQFSRNSNLKVHMRRHLGEKPYACHLCKSKFSASGDLTRHLLLHTGEKPFKCEQCDSSFSQKAHLDGHMRSHSTERPFKCPQCDSCYTQKNNLAFHMRKHSGEKPYSCRLCTAKFWGQYDLKRHVQRSH